MSVSREVPRGTKKRSHACSLCKGPRDVPGQAVCRACHREDMKERRKACKRVSTMWRVDAVVGSERRIVRGPTQQRRTAEGWMQFPDEVLVKVDVFETVVNPRRKVA